MIIKMAILGIVGLVVIAIALSPSPGDVLHQAQSMTTPGQALAQSDPAADPIFASLAVVPGEVAVNLSQTFTVEVWINNVTDMAGWEINLLWNSSVLKCIQAQVNTPPEWGGTAFNWFNKTEADANNIDPNSVYTAWQFGSGIDNNYNATYGQYEKCECMGPYGSGYDNTFNGSLAIVTLTFQALQAGSTSLALCECVQHRTDGWYAWENIIDNEHAGPIVHTVQNALVKVQAP